MKEITMELFLRFISICAVLLIAGIGYAYYIAKRPLPPKLTWFSVLIGDFVTDVGMGALIYLLTENLFLALIPFICHALTGGPMILGQLIKHAIQNGGNIIIDEEQDGDGTQALA